jgi:hypothetical protein
MLKRLSPLNIHYRQGEKLLENVSSSLTSDHFWMGGNVSMGKALTVRKAFQGILRR